MSANPILEKQLLELSNDATRAKWRVEEAKGNLTDALQGVQNAEAVLAEHLAAKEILEAAGFTYPPSFLDSLAVYEPMPVGASLDGSEGTTGGDKE